MKKESEKKKKKGGGDVEGKLGRVIEGSRGHPQGTGVNSISHSPTMNLNWVYWKNWSEKGKRS